jgi:hypothetical protein
MSSSTGSTNKPNIENGIPEPTKNTPERVNPAEEYYLNNDDNCDE